MAHRTFRQIGRYLLVGSMVFSVDMFTYFIGIMANLPIPIAKGIAFICAVIVAFFSHRLWTFSVENTTPKQTVRFGCLYLSNFFANVSSNSLFIHLLDDEPYGLLIAYMGATCLCSLINFLGLKYFVFPRAGRSQTHD